MRVAVTRYLDARAHHRQGSPPPVLVLADRCQTWRTLPYAGGLLDQPEALMQQLDVAIGAREAWLYQQRQSDDGR